jgi:hypothetical protein
VEAAVRPLNEKIAKFADMKCPNCGDMIPSGSKKCPDCGKAIMPANEGKFAERAKTLVQGLKDKKRWLPAFDKQHVEEIFGELVKAETVITFTEGEGDKKTEVKKPLDQLFAEFIEGLKVMPAEGDITGGGGAAKGKLVPFNASASEHVVIDADSAEMAEAAQAMSTEKKIPYGDALTRVRAERREAGRAAAGAV